ncbi:6-phosphofructokinase [Pedobacter antarcticus]|uniref:ATP-dependent 6-phosphofructokinase n=2 Tax=Pedobacter antarcticus TaxID=34086 RepID=A0A081PDY1_9SPHI|nr:6-phosphofructokinase [Pedobacter antarcticus]KEQ28904.1 6-phosphofructokinase [Pedobacter antarcticus 4BY]SDM76593.1 6-phosphofructokinase [Pedobacter antarcticus]SFE71384.1 6-phosphofructokinase [Pedobacter antarcticus]
MNKIKNIAVLTSGGDAPGMNAAIRAVVRAGIYYGMNVTGVLRGYDGLVNGDFIPMDRKSVANIIQRGGTILKTARSEDFKTKEGRQRAYDQLIKHEIDALVVIGGDGTFTGANLFTSEFDFPVIGLPGTIDNDLAGTDFTIGYDTAINTVVNAIDKIRDTAESHDRLFIVEVMGRDSGLIALRSGIGVGAEAIMIPEANMGVEGLIKRLEYGRKDKSSKIIIVAEGDEIGGAFNVGEVLKENFPNYDIRVSVLGHIQRGGKPSCMDRVLASRFGVAAVEGLMEGRSGDIVGQVNREIVFTPFDHAIKHIDAEEISPAWLKLVEILSL